MSAYEQKVEPPDRKWQYLLFAAEPYETISFKVGRPAGIPLWELLKAFLMHSYQCSMKAILFCFLLFFF